MNTTVMKRMIRLRASAPITALLWGLFLSWGARSVSTLTPETATRYSGKKSVRSLLAADSPLSEYMLPRNVTIRPNPSRGKMLPIQMYHGPSVPARTKMPEINWNEKDTLGSNLENLSKAAQAQIMGLLETYSSLSNDEQGKVRTRLAAAARAATPLDPSQHLHILYLDEHICVTNKPSGILSVPGPRRNPSLAELVYNAVQPLGINIDQMVVHRIDMDTSGIVVYALTALALRQLHADFRDRKVRKTYTALLAGHISSSSEVEVDLALERDPHRPPFMRVTQQEVYHPSLEDLAAYPGLHKFVNQAPKPSLTDLSVQSLEYIPRRDDSGSEDNVKVHVHVDSSKSSLAVTRVSLTPHTGRTHQLRVHTAALGFPVVGDDIYGFQGNGDCGIAAEVLDAAFPDRERVQRGLADLNLPLCLHAQQLCLFHPLTGAPMVFQCDAPF